MTTVWDPEEAIKYKGPDRVVHFTEYLLEKAGKANLGKRFSCGFLQFNEKMGGLETGEVIVITGHRKEGKTLFAESWIASMNKRNPEAKAFILSYEVEAEKLLAKYVKDDKNQIYVPMELKTMDYDWLWKRCYEAKFKFNCRIILIDHLHFLVDMNTNQNLSLNIGAFMRRLKQDIAIKLGMAVILIAHQGQPRDGKEASIDSIRDSSFVAQESDATIVISRKENYDEADIKTISKNQGPEMGSLLSPPSGADGEDNFSARLALVKIECHRRTGVYRWKKLFQKRGEFLEEV